MPLTASKLRENIYRILDEVLRTGEPVEVVRKGRVIRIVPGDQEPALDRLPKRPVIVGDPEDLVHLDWSHEWRP
jgi:prevent-host-death family protein